MIRGKDGGMLTVLCKPLCIILLVIGLFSLVWLRSNIVQSSYEIRKLEESRMESLKNMNVLLAERARLMSLEYIDASLRKKNQSKKIYAQRKYVFPDRVRVVQVKRSRGAEPYKATLDVRNEP